MEVINYLQEKGFMSIDDSFYANIRLWASWHKGHVNEFHEHKMYNGKKFISRKRFSLRMAERVCSDIADLLMNEKVSILINDEKIDNFAKGVLKKNKFNVKANEMQALKAAYGTVAYVPYMQGVKVDTITGKVSGGEIKINYVTADYIYPLSWDNGEITECAFGAAKRQGKKDYLYLQIHRLSNAGYVIENKLFETTNGKFVETSLKELKQFKNLAVFIETNSFDRQFVIDRLNLLNNIDKDNPMGISLFANSIDILQAIDITYDSYVREFIIGKKRIFVKPEMAIGLDGDITGFDLNDETFYMLPEDDANSDTLIKEVDMNLRAEEHEKALNDHLNLLSLKIGFGREHYKFEKGTLRTATEVISTNSDLYKSVCKHEIILEDVLKELVDIIIRLGNTYLEMNFKDDTDINIGFDDSIIEDTQSEFQRDLLLTNAGALTVEELRAKYVNETIEEAKKKISNSEQMEDEE